MSVIVWSDGEVADDDVVALMGANEGPGCSSQDCPVIPVLLPGAAEPALPLFLQGMTSVDLREQDEAKIDRLVWGITGRKPEPLG